jgi:transcriptional regulator with XRE-family HTH domain
VTLLAVIRQAINASDKPRTQIVKETGLSRSQLSRLIRSGPGLSLQGLEKLAGALDLEIIVRPRSRKSAILGQPIEALGFSVRTRNCLTQHAAKPVRTIRQLVKCSEATLTAIPRSGLLVVEEIRQALARHGLRLKGER